MNPLKNPRALALYAALAALALLMALWAGLPSLLFAVLLSLLVLTAAGVTYMFHLSERSLKAVTAWVLKAVYRPRIKGLENVVSLKSGPTLVVCNHTSFIDVPFLVAFLPGRLTFAIDIKWAEAWWLKPFLRTIKALPVNPAQPLAARGLIECLERGETVVIFPEGRVTDTGGLMKVYEGPGLIALKSQARILPVVIDGLQYRRFSRFRPHLLWPVRGRVSMTVHPPQTLDCPEIKGGTQHDHRRRVTNSLYDLMCESLLKSADLELDLWTALREAARKFGPNRPILEDVDRRLLTYAQVVREARLLGRRLADVSRRGENFGLMLPNSNPLALALFGLWSEGRTGVLLNYSQGQCSLTSAVATARISTVLTSRRFLETTGLGPVAEGLGVRLLYVEDMKYSRAEKIAARLKPARPAGSAEPAAIIFTSGSEGRPKGVVLSHANIMANNYQFKYRMPLNENDVFFNAMPMFHSMGLTLCVLFPILHGMRLFNFVTPLSAHLIPELIYDTRATLTVASDTFASTWGRNADSYDFARLRYLISGAEKVKPKTRELYSEKFGLRIMEGYGVSETTPVLSVNTPFHNKAGSVGRPLPGITARLEPVEGVERGGRLVVKGPNVMLGYLMSDQPGVLQPPADGWHDTGDIVEIDDDGFIWIKGRFKRFAKIGAEMISLAAVEEVSAALWPGQPHAVIALEAEHKGEKLVLVSSEKNPDLPGLWQALSKAGLPELAFPRQTIFLEEIPVTPLGKINMPKLIEEVKAQIGDPEPES
jgi:acyl-[acyl-carrier-protein]-phospholipid O-acyltransferase/long-chain-fatty-acid--[acyl-carrier-protein] ligase